MLIPRFLRYNPFRGITPVAQAAIKAVFFDAGNTLFAERLPRGSVYARAARKYGSSATEEETLESIVRGHGEFPSSVGGNFRYSLGWFEAFNRNIFATLGVAENRRDKAHGQILKHFRNARNYRVFPEVPKVLGELAGRGLVLGVISNWSELLPELCQELGIAAMVDFIVTSAELRAEKPERAIFDRALFRAGVPAEQALHVGDNFEHDVRGALGAGMRAALLDRQNGNGGITRDGVPMLNDLREVLSLVGQPVHAPKN